MKVLVLGATGEVGQHIVKQLLNRGHSVTALIRNPEKLKSVPTHMTVVRGDVLDWASLSAAVDGQDAVIYAVGTNSNGPTTLFSDSTRILLDLMQHSGVKRLVCITGIGAGETKGHGGFFYDHIIYPLFAKNRYQDKDRQEKMIRNSGLDWVIVRPAPFHEGGHNGPIQAVTNVEGVTLRRISRQEVAQFVVDQLTDDLFLRQTPFIGHAR
jgi:putative NADH-flavin reductase